MKNKNVKVESFVSKKGNKRRQFLKMSGLAIAGSGFILSCSDDDDFTEPNPDPDPDTINLGSGNLGILNYAYALEQLEAAFYEQVLQGGYYASATQEEQEILMDLRNHEVIHREFFKTAISSAAPNDIIPDLNFDFIDIDFDDKSSVLSTAKVLEDTGVAAYNGAGKLIDASDEAGETYLLLAGKIVSVEARHASAIADLINPGSSDFASGNVIVELSGTGPAYDRALSPAEILGDVGETGFLQDTVSGDNLPIE